MENTVMAPHNFTPRDYQLPFLDAMDSGCKRAGINWHRRAGKTKTLISLVAGKMFERVGSYYYFFQTFQRARKVLWEAMDHTGFRLIEHIPIECVKCSDNSGMFLRLSNGSLLELYGIDNTSTCSFFENGMRLGVLDDMCGCVFDCIDMNTSNARFMWNVINRSLNRNDGWAVFCEDFPSLIPRGPKPVTWFLQTLTIDDTKKPDGTPVVDPVMVGDCRDSGMSEESIQREFYCVR